MHMSGSQTETVELILCSTVGVKYVPSRYKICVLFGDPTDELNALVFAFKAGIAKYKVKFLFALLLPLEWH